MTVLIGTLAGLNCDFSLEKTKAAFIRYLSKEMPMMGISNLFFASLANCCLKSTLSVRGIISGALIQNIRWVTHGKVQYYVFILTKVVLISYGSYDFHLSV